MRPTPLYSGLTGRLRGSNVLLFDDLDVGREWVSAERAVATEDVVAFADLTGDRNPVHLEPEFARTMPFRRCIAHGLLGLCLAAEMTTAAAPVRTVAFLGHPRVALPRADLPQRCDPRNVVGDREGAPGPRAAWHGRVADRGHQSTRAGCAGGGSATLVEAARGAEKAQAA